VLGNALRINLWYTLGYHPQANGGAKHINQTLETYLRIYCLYQQDNWDCLLPLAKFAYNNLVHKSTGVLPFFANKGYHLLWNINLDQRLDLVKAWDFAMDLKEVQKNVSKQLQYTWDRYKAYANTNQKPAPNFANGTEAYILAKWIKTTRPSKKLSNKYIGPYKIVWHVGESLVLMELPNTMQSVHPVFHVSQLEPHAPNAFPKCHPLPPPKVKVKGADHWEVAHIVDTAINKRYANPLRYCVKWLGYKTALDNLWYKWVGLDNMAAGEYINDFHAQYPKKPGPAQCKIAIAERDAKRAKNATNNPKPKANKAKKGKLDNKKHPADMETVSPPPANISTKTCSSWESKPTTKALRAQP
jgi:hypothetical protein